MTDREKAIVMAYTGIAMLTGEKIEEFYKYLAELYGRPVYTHEIVTLDIQEKAKPDFVELCRTEQSERKKGEWIPCSVRLPDVAGRCLVVNIAYYSDPTSWQVSKDVIAWLPFPEPWEGGE